MSRSRYASLLAVIAAGLVSLLNLRPMYAQQPPSPGTMVIEVPDPLSREPLSRPLSVYLNGRLTAFAGDTVCTSAAMGTTGRLVLGTPQQPAACRTAGTLLTFVSGAGDWMWLTLEFEPGAIKQFTNFAPHPPGTRYPGYICDFLEGQGVERGECSAFARSRGGIPVPATVGNAGLVARESSLATPILVLLAVGFVGIARWRTVRDAQPRAHHKYVGETSR